MRSPGWAVLRRMALPSGTDPMTVMSARTPEGDCATSPPARVTPACLAVLRSPSKNWSTQRCGRSAGSARERNAAKGSPPMAAMSESPRVRQRWPMESAGCHSRRKCTPSSEKSVVTSVSVPGGVESTAQSSPMDWSTRAEATALGGTCRLAGVSDAFDETGFSDRHDLTEYSETRVGKRRGGQDPGRILGGVHQLGRVKKRELVEKPGTARSRTNPWRRSSTRKG